MNLTEAFRALDKLEEETFSVDNEGIKKLQAFVDTDDSVDELAVYDLDIDADDADTKELDVCHEGDAILDCCVCHSKLFKPVTEIVVDEEKQLANVGEECPYCYSEEGYKVVGEVKPIEDIDSKDETEIEISSKEDTFEIEEDIEEVNISTDDVDIEIEDKEDEVEEVAEESEEIIDESVDLLTKENTIASLLKDNMSELASIIDVNELREKIIELVDNSNIASKPVAQKLKRDLYSKKSAGALLSTIATYMTGDKVIKTGRYKKAANESHKRKSIKESEITWPRNITSDKGRAFISNLNDLLYNKYRFAGINPFGPGIVDGLDISKNQSKKFTNFTVYFNDVKPVSEEKLFGDNIDKHYSNFKNDFTNLVSEFDAQKLIISDFDDKFHTVRIKIPNEWLMTESKSSREYKEIIKESDSNEETIGDKLKKYQMWVDYDMEHYSKVSKTTQDIIDKEGLQLIKDQYGDYEVSVGHYKAESIRNRKRKLKEDIGSTIDKYQKWVDYDMKRYGKVSDITRKKIEQAGLQLVKDQYGDYEISAGKYDESCKKDPLKEEVEEIKITTDDLEISIDADEDKEKIVDEESEECEEIIEPVSNETKEEIDLDIDEFDKETFEDVAEECLKENYINVKFFKSGRVSQLKNKLIVEGVIGFKSGKKRNTKFVLEAYKSNKNNISFLGENLQLTPKKNSISLKGKVKGKKFFSESLSKIR